jgi:hypothetical protein
VTHLPQDTFTTNAGGEIAFEVQPQPGQTEVAISFGGQTYVLELADAVVPPGTGPLSVSFDVLDFSDPSSALQSTATIVADFGGWTPTQPVVWTVEDVVNPSAPWWLRGPAAKNGLSWGPTANGASMWSADAVEGTPPSGDTAQLTDIVGQRTVLVKVETELDGTPFSATANVTFGRGPLSVFSTAPSSGTAQFMTNTGIALGNWAVTSPSNSFPAAAACGGSVDNASVTITVIFPTVTVNYAPGSGWETIYLQPFNVNSLYSTTSRLPSYPEIVAVGRNVSTFYPTISKKGAAVAAGWADEYYISGNIDSISLDYGHYVYKPHANDGIIIISSFSDYFVCVAP